MRPSNVLVLVYLLFVSACIVVVSFYFPQSIAFIITTVAFSSVLLKDPKFITLPKLILFAGILAVGSFITTVIETNVWLLGGFLFFVTILSVYLSQRLSQYFYSCLVINLLLLLWVYFPINHFLGIMGGVAVVMVGRLIWFLFPLLIKREIRSILSEGLRELNQLSKEIFSMLQSAYGQNEYLFERRLHHQKNQYLNVSNQLNELLSEQKIVASMNKMYDQLLAIAQLRNRISDYTILSVCQKELSELEVSISREILHLNVSLRKKNILENHLANIDNSINSFETIYNNILRVTAKEPLPLFLFIFDLKAFNQTLRELQIELEQW